MYEVMYICVTLLSLEAVVVLGANVKKALPKVLKCFNSFTLERERESSSIIPRLYVKRQAQRGAIICIKTHSNSLRKATHCSR